MDIDATQGASSDLETAENLTTITADENIRRYNVPWIW